MLFFLGISQLELAGYLAAAPALASHLLHLPTTAESPTTYRPLFNTAKAKVKKKNYPSACTLSPSHMKETHVKKKTKNQVSLARPFVHVYVHT